MKLALIGLVLLAGCAKPHQLSNVNDGMTDTTTVYGHCPGPDCYDTTNWSGRSISGDCRPGVPGLPINCKQEAVGGYNYVSDARNLCFDPRTRTLSPCLLIREPDPGPMQGQWMAKEDSR